MYELVSYYKQNIPSEIACVSSSLALHFNFYITENYTWSHKKNKTI